MIEAIAAFAAWLGAALIVVSDGRYGLGAGIAIATAALSVLAWQSAGPLEAGAILAGGASATALRLRSGPRSWNVLPPGSTPRLVLCIACGLVAFWVAASVMTGQGAGLRYGALTAIALAGGRVLATDEASAATTAIAALALALGVAAAIGGAPGLLPYAVSAVVAAAASAYPRRRADAR